MDNDLSVFDDRPEKQGTHECRICGKSFFGSDEPDGDLCFQCWVRRDKAEAEYIAILTHGGTR